MKKQGSGEKRRPLRYGCTIVFAVLLIALSSCAPSNEGTDIASQTPTASPEPAETAAPTSTPVPAATPEPTPVYTFTGQAYCDSEEYVNIRDEANTESEIIGEFPAEEAADIIEYSEGWAHLVYNGTEGYVSRDYLLEIHPPSVEIPEGDWASIVVNPTNFLPEDFEVTLADFENGQVNERILEVCEQMFADAKADGVDLKLVDAYRSYDTQNDQYEKKVKSIMEDKGYSRSKAEIEAAKITARPNTSEHQTGLVLDIVSSSHRSRNAAFAKTKAFKWLDENAYNYGFTLRYKKDKVDITKVIYEPWHWRFVGVKAAAQMKISGECMEEYFDVMN